MSFSFVDQIESLEPGRSARGTVTVPDAVSTFPCCLVIEAVGQLAAWVAMAAVDFTRRPVAALTRHLVLGPDHRAGTRLDLAVGIERCDLDTVVYSGTASVAGVVVVRLERCLGPMLPIEDFDDPAAMRVRFADLRTGRRDGNFAARGPWQLPFEPIDGEDGEHCHAVLAVPERAAFFAEHFPRKPVVPATLLGDAQVRLAVMLGRQAVSESQAAGLKAVGVRAIKARSFVVPGDRLTLSAHILAARGAGAEVAVSARRGAAAVASARVELGMDSSDSSDR